MGNKLAAASKSNVSLRKANRVIEKYDAVVTIPAQHLSNIYNDTAEISEHVRIICSNNRISFSSEGYTENKFGINGRMARSSATMLEENGIDYPYKIKYAVGKDLSYEFRGVFMFKDLAPLHGCQDLCGNIEIYMKTNYPIVFKYNTSTLNSAIVSALSVGDPAKK